MSKVEQKDYYGILGLEKGATIDEVNKAFKKLAVKWHPDKFATASEEERKQAEEKFKDISEAHNVLSDPQKKELYDNGGFDQNNMDGFNPEDFMNMDPFSFFHGGPRQRKGKDVRTTVEITIEESFRGAKKKVKIPKERPCEHCHGTGSEDGMDHTCPECGGSGVSSTREQRGNTIYINQHPCGTCHGFGKLVNDPCHECGGTGRITYYDEIEVDIPRGASDGMTFTLQGMGEPGPGGLPNGNLYIQVIINQNEGDYFVIDGNRNVIHIEEVPFNEALTGTERVVKCLDGKKKTLKIPELTKDDTSFVLKGKGLPNPMGNGSGNYYVIVRHKYPKKLTKEMKEALNNFEKFD